MLKMFENCNEKQSKSKRTSIKLIKKLPLTKSGRILVGSGKFNFGVSEPVTRDKYCGNLTPVSGLPIVVCHPFSLNIV